LGSNSPNFDNIISAYTTGFTAAHQATRSIADVASYPDGPIMMAGDVIKLRITTASDAATTETWAAHIIVDEFQPQLIET
jgi:hypothetical protein